MTDRIERSPEDLIPLTHLTYHIMLVMRAGPSHGYAIARDVDQLSRGRLKPGTGTFYSAIRRMIDEAVLEEVDRPADADSEDSRRRYYALTPFGREVLAAERVRLTELLGMTDKAEASG